MTCKLCGLDLPLIDAHIIPKPFFVAYGSPTRGPRVFSNKPGVHPKRVRTGFYDSEILCQKCDGKIGVWDQYGVELFLKGLGSFQPFPTAKSPVGYVRTDFDFKRTRLFLLSVLWRAHISSLAMFARVRLGPYAERLAEMIRINDVGKADEFTTVLSVFTVDGKFSPSGVPIMDPFRERWNGANAYRLSMGSITAYIKTDRSKFPESFEMLALAEGKPLCLLDRDFMTSSEANVARSIAHAPLNVSTFRKSSSPHDA